MSIARSPKMDERTGCSKAFPERFTVFTGHKESAQELPPGTAHLLSSEPCPYQMFRYKTNVYATQFHPEADCESFEMRIRIYKDMGYFAPEDSGRLVTDLPQCGRPCSGTHFGKLSSTRIAKEAAYEFLCVCNQKCDRQHRTAATFLRSTL